ncbi:glycine betaine ABC transporter substrate-binding protein [Caproiciproducens faecalis]|uniref:glycine betaine ABC transporter substrate-binding protein n=1 Tax=Caproiciproducens faecalis TaxID=2820301 RepID=UPI0021027977|nr:glycine betaine ABC transporter substrate-binding protein [Caproiciproducens faecalis]
MKKIIAVMMSLILALSAAGCGSGKSGGNEIVIMDGQFSEMKLIHRMVKLLVEQDTDAKVVIKDEVSPVNGFNELVKGSCDLMNSYDGTLLTTYLKLDTKDIPEGQTLYDFANETALKEKKVSLLDKLGINNTYAIAVPQKIADQYKLETISDLVPVADKLVFGAEHEFFSEEGSMKFNPFVKFYGLNFKESKPVDLGLKYSAVENGNIDVTEVYATDGLNKKAQLKVLKDDKNFFPEYNGALLVRSDLFERFKDTAPNLKETLNKLGGIFDNETMVNLTYAVDVEGKSVDDVAKQFLQEKGLLK